MNCKYCDKPCKVIMDYIEVFKKEGYQCIKCEVEYLSNGVINIYTKSFYFQYRTVDHSRFINRNTGELILDIHGVPPEITPSNIIEKFKLYMLFS